MRRTGIGWVLALGLATAGTLAQERDFSGVEIKAEHAAGAVYMLTGAGGNIGISVGDDGVLVVDDQFAALVPKIEAAIRGITDKPVRFVLNTHWHYDHTGGNQQLAKRATLIAHDNVRRRLADGHPNVAGREIPPAPTEALPVITFEHSLTVHFNGEPIRALHYAHGHTDGDSMVFFPESNVVHMGDDFVTYGLPFVDVPSGGSIRGMIRALEQALAELPEDVKVIPGHGPLCGKSDVRGFVDMLRDAVHLVEQAMAEGKTVAEMQEDGVLAKYEDQGRGFVKTADFIALIHAELSEQGASDESSSRRHH